MDNYKLSSIGKLFFANLLVAMSSDDPKSFMKLKGTPQQVKAVTDAIIAQKNFQEELKNPSATVESIIQKMREKNQAAAEFKQQTGRPWPL